MRRRLLLVLLLFSSAAVAGFAVPLLVTTAAERTQRFALDRTADLDRFAALAQQSRATDDLVPLTAEVRAHTELYGEPVLIVDARRLPLAGTNTPDLTTALDAALRNQPTAPVPTVLPWSSGEIVFARPVGAGTRVEGAVVLRANVDRAAADVARRWLWVLLGALTAASASILLVTAVTRWLLHPVAELEAGVRAVALGHRNARVAAVSGPPELRELAVLFNRMAETVGEAAERQRELIADTSHSLRNPMAALRLRLDALAPNIRPKAERTYTAALTEADRLESMLNALLALASAESRTTESRTTESRTAETAHGDHDELCDVTAVVADRADAWRTPPPPPTPLPVLVRCRAEDVAQVLDVLLDNADKHGGAARVAVGADRAVGTAWFEVHDDGPGLPEEDLPRATTRFWRGDTDATGTGLGLAIAHELVKACGGRLLLTSPGGLRARVELPLEPPL
ncbi:HAMP domain-containing histidine kinase [Actinosynnema pretiosum subsp. pretiosum]|uniref:histidine kinase n=1 Tax=Actinosynnema pretiosum subsp. pretiosum TaxID=103721 RepID=A0AA45LA81_9PSEU|nr:putative two-component system sensor kinase [Actinosynnema pretiosum subsp. pretiosum]QUF06217.1 HAMP domain-containing histidine kinase [Actinosynnema pretiosum subsp. pretiosum]